MARQKLINLHSSGTTTTSLLSGDNALVLGEIAVQHVDGDAKLHIRLTDGTGTLVTNKLGSFITETAIDTKIASVGGDVTALSAKVGAGFEGKTITEAINDEVSARKNADTTINNTIGSGFSTTDTVRKAIDDEATARGTVATNLANEVARATSAESALDTAIKANKGDIDTLSAKVGDGFDSTNTVAKAISDETTNRQNADG